MGDKKEVSRYFIIVGLLVLLYITFLLVKPYLTYVLLAFLLAYACYPIYNKLQKKIKNKTFASAIMIIAILIIIFIPLFFIVSSLVDQSRDVYGMATRQNIDATLNNIENALHLKEDLNIYVDAVILRIKESTLKMIPNVITGITEATVGLFIMFFIMFYLFKEGDVLINSIRNYLPMSRKHKKLLFQNTERVTKGVIYGQILTAIIQGGIAGIGFIIFGVSNPIFWGFIMMILAFIPVVGAWLIWWPAVAISIAQGNYVTGIGLAVYGLIIVSNVDNLVRPKLVGDRAKLHPALVLIGVLGGLKLFGFIGMLIGPVFFSILFVFFKVYMEISDKKSKA